MTLEERLAKQELATQRLFAINAIQNCMGFYEFVHLTSEENHRTPECFALWREDVSVEVSDWGCFFGPEAVKAFWGAQKAEDNRGALFFHTLATPVIEVAGDCKTAKVTWASPGFETMPPIPGLSDEYKSYWCWGKYAMDFIRHPETGEWKIWHMKWFRTIRNDYYVDWYQDAKNTMKGMPGGFTHPDAAPSVFHRPYSSDEIPHPFPATPEPYESYDGTFRWPYGGASYEERYAVHYPEEYCAKYNVNYPNNI